MFELFKKEFPYITEQQKENFYFDKILRVIVPNENLLEICMYLKNSREFLFDYLSFITAIDYKDFFEIVYYLFSHKNNYPLILKTSVTKDNPVIDSVVTIWQTSNWNEREIYDMFGIEFKGHPDLRRIFLSDEWIGFPLRKDFVHKPDRYD